MPERGPKIVFGFEKVALYCFFEFFCHLPRSTSNSTPWDDWLVGAFVSSAGTSARAEEQGTGMCFLAVDNMTSSWSSRTKTYNGRAERKAAANDEVERQRQALVRTVIESKIPNFCLFPSQSEKKKKRHFSVLLVFLWPHTPWWPLAHSTTQKDVHRTSPYERVTHALYVRLHTRTCNVEPQWRFVFGL
jgi:hypothetical protein